MKRVLTSAVFAMVLFRMPDAFACGGFFCSQQPVLQTAERIVFELDGELVTVYVQLQYSGSDPNFAWIVPVPEVPDVEVGVGQEMFSILEDQTKPVFVAASTTAVEAATQWRGAQFSCGGTGGNGGGSFGEPRLTLRYVPRPDVDVWQSERVGPFEVVTVSADDARDLDDWLGINGYRVQAGSQPIVQEYLDQGMKLLALKLAPEEVSSSIEPIKMTYHDSRGCGVIPIKLTAIAAMPNLEITTWVFGESRAWARNYSVLESPLDRVFRADDYPGRLAKEIDALGGRAFVTEYAAKTERLPSFGNPLLEEMIAKHGYMTRLRTYLDPNEMTVDPEFDTDAEGGDVDREISLAPPIEMGMGVFLSIALVGIWIARKRS